MTQSSSEKGRLDYDDIRSGMALMQTVYTVAMVLGLERVIEASYDLFISAEAGSRDWIVEAELALILSTILLLSIRFFWVPRNLNSYIVQWFPETGEKVFSRMTMIHFPIALVHAVLFYYICHSFVDMVVAGPEVVPNDLSSQVGRFSLLYAALLVLNSAWLHWITPPEYRAQSPGGIWASNNLWFSAAALVGFALWRIVDFPTTGFVLGVCALFLANSFIDLAVAAKYYILYER